MVLKMITVVCKPCNVIFVENVIRMVYLYARMLIFVCSNTESTFQYNDNRLKLIPQLKNSMILSYYWVQVH